MGAWGQGPFDSDGGLDYLGNLADQLDVNIDQAAHADGSGADQDRLETLLRDTLAGTTEDTPTWECDGGYAAAGLIAAALRPDLGRRQRGTRLLGDPTEAAADPVGLGAHCGYLALLDAQTAERLRADATAAIARLRGNAPWMRMWRSPIEGTLDALAAALTDAG